MFLLDENVSEAEVLRLRRWGIHVRVVGHDLGRIGTADEDLLPLLRRLKRPVLFTQDAGFFRFDWLHPNYGLIWIDARPAEAANLIRRFLKHPRFNTQSKRLGLVARVHLSGVQFWRKGDQRPAAASWEK